MKLIALFVLVSVASTGCKTVETNANLSATTAAGPMCEGLDTTKIKDPKRRARLMAFLLKMMMKDNPRATSLFLAATQNMAFDSFMVEWNTYLKTKNRGALLSKVDGKIAEGDINIDVEERAAKEATQTIKEGEGGIGIRVVNGQEVMLNSALAQAKLGEAFRAAIEAGAMTELEARSEFESMFKETFSAENNATGGLDVSKTAIAAQQQRRLSYIEMIANAAEKAGLNTRVRTNGVARTVSITDVALTQGYIESVVELANAELNRPTARGVDALRARYNEMKFVYGEKLVDQTKMKELVETLERGRKNKGDKDFKSLQERGRFDKLTNSDALIREAEKSGSRLYERLMERKAGRKK